MACYRLMELASQAEAEGITLGELLARDLSPRELDSIQADLSSEISDSYAEISSFMADVDIPSIEELLEFGPEEYFDLLMDEEHELSDAA